MPFHSRSFTVAIACISRFLILRERLQCWAVPAPRSIPGLSTQRLAIPSGADLLDAVFVEPSASPARAALLLCHGIGETADQWFPVQQLLAVNGIASLLFDYSGYGRSTGRPNWTQYDLDALSAFHALRRLTHPLPSAILGFSMGSGPAAAIANTAAPDRLILCAAFTSFRDAARAIGLPAVLDPFVPPIWSVRDLLRDCQVPVLIVHGEKDRLFPVQMARQLASCSPGSELLIVPNTGHRQPFCKPGLSYWGPIISRITP